MGRVYGDVTSPDRVFENPLPTILVCAECGRKPRRNENAEDDWRCYSDGAGELIVFCPECAEREFGRGNPRRTSEGNDFLVT
jgi:hypothetical protein